MGLGLTTPVDRSSSRPLDIMSIKGLTFFWEKCKISRVLSRSLPMINAC